MNPVDVRLRAMLAGGPQQSRDVLAVLTVEGFTQKQLRRARENIGVAVTRSGRGKDMRSFWSLPAELPVTSNPADKELIRAHDAEVRNRHLPTPCLTADDESPTVATANLQQFEYDRIAQRVPQFVKRGLDQATAQQVALLLTVHRDRPGIRGGSCAECQNMRSPRACIAADAGFAEGPRPVTEVWSCGYARLGGSRDDVQTGTGA